MSDLISRKEALEAITGAWGLDGCTTWICQTVIKGLPAAHPEPETGEWIEDEVQTYIEKMYHCSNCGFKAWGGNSSSRRIAGDAVRT